MGLLRRPDVIHLVKRKKKRMDAMIIRENKPRKRRQFLYTAWEVQFKSYSFQHFILTTNVFGLIVPAFCYYYFTKFN